MTVRVALIGANGFGVSHRRVLAPLQAAGGVELVALCDLAPVQDEPEAPVPPGAQVFTDYRALLAAVAVDVAIIATPPHTHLAIATAAARAGADLLLEKPPVLSLAEHTELTRLLAATGRVCQVGFQALGSAALAALTEALSGGLGMVRAISAIGAWQREDAYYQRSPWAGRRSLAGRPVLDGVLVNPFAHAVMQALAVAEAAAGRPVWPVEVELERYRVRPIEVDDTAVLRVRLDHGPPVVVAATLCADQLVTPTVLVHTDQGRAELGYTTDQLRLPGEAAPREVPGRTGLVENLLEHRIPGGPPLLAALDRTAGFTALVEAITSAPDPVTIAARHRADHGVGPQRVVTVPGISKVLRRAADELALPSELAVAWAAAAPHRATTTPLQTGAASAGG